jgi:hypothetical protein
MAHVSKIICCGWLAAMALTLGASAEEGKTSEQIKKTVRGAARAVTDAGEEVSEEIQGKPEDDDGELVEGMRTNTGRGYGPAGCGLGSILFVPDSGFTQVFAATTNGSFGTQTFGITSGTSNCDEPEAGAEGARAFVETNRAALAKDIARGRGETITALTRLGGCAEASHVGTSLQQRFAQIFPSAARSDREVSRAVIDLLRSEASLHCAALGS